MITVSNTFKTNIDASSRRFNAKCEIYFDGDDYPPVIFEGNDDIVNMSLLEEAYAEGASPLGNISSNELSITLNNIDHKFTYTNTESPYYGKLVPNIKIIAYIGLEVSDDVFEYVTLGTFRSNDWDTSTGIEVSTTCHDRLYEIMKLQCPAIPVIQNTTIKAMFEYIFQSIGLQESEYSVDSSLAYNLPFAWIPKNNVGEILQQLAWGGSCLVTMNRNNVLVVKDTFNITAQVGTLTDEAQIINATIPQKYLQIYTKVIVKSKRTIIKDTDSIFKLDNIVVPPGSSTLNKIEFTNGPVAMLNQLYCVNSVNTTITNIQYNTWSITLTLNNSGSTDETINIEGFGQIIDTVDIEAIATNATKTYGIEKTMVVDSIYIQTATLASNYADRILSLISDPAPYINIEYRGNPAIEIWDILQIINPTEKIGTLSVVPVRNILNYDGGLSASMVAMKLAILQ